MTTDFADPNAPPKSKVVSTGSSEIDKKLGGGIPLGSMTLIEGESDSGKSVLSQQMIWGSLYDGFNVVLYTTENTLKSFVRQMSSLSLEISDFLLLGRLKIFTIQASKLKLTPEEVFTLLLAHLNSNKETDIVVMDSLTTFITHTSIEDTMSYFENCKELCDDGMSVINIVNSYAFNEAGLARVRSISDAHLTLKTEQMGDMIVKVLEVAKVRGAELSTGNIISFDVEPMLGMKIIPINKVSV
ncbi:MAG: ATPase domain-containing protein [SAR202 cluster bacterium]|jgi:flagellar protein FlaH|nr:ATPase domain-containing protein [SAR202 cluster bacterium]MDP6514410.1 ATPase domain-containing protein [SAR202 cluster bacterium]MDP6714965.1 ATPase domain-containing protein [SAR202 cluster bacterium]